MGGPNRAFAILRKGLPLVALLASLAVAQGCADYQVRTPDSDTLSEPYQREEPTAFFWGLMLDPQVVTADCEDGVNDVVVKRAFIHDLVSVLTLGIVMPTAVEYRCRAPRGDSGSFPEAPEEPEEPSRGS